MNIDSVLSICSKDVFLGLEYGEYRILSILAKNGPLNQKEIGILASKYTIRFDRWGVKKRLNGSLHFLGLIPCDYIQTIKINKKETKYGLTVKGLLAVLSQTRFEDIFLVKRFSEFLQKWTSDSKWIDYTLNYIKYEISYFLFYNYIQGIGWTKFRFLQDYLWKTRLKGGYPILDKDEDIIPKNQKALFEVVQQQFGKCFLTGDSVLDHVPPKQVMNQLRRMLEKKSLDPKIVKNVILFLLKNYWFYYIDLVEINRPIKEFFISYVNALEPDLFSDSTQIARTAKIRSKQR